MKSKEESKEDETAAETRWCVTRSPFIEEDGLTASAVVESKKESNAEDDFSSEHSSEMKYAHSKVVYQIYSPVASDFGSTAEEGKSADFFTATYHLPPEHDPRLSLKTKRISVFHFAVKLIATSSFFMNLFCQGRRDAGLSLQVFCCKT